MSLAPGAQLGPYEIVSILGAGGMGEVYRARDTRLGRTVAIKVLSAELAREPGARERLEREAKAISALNHPNICTLFDVGHHDGTEFLVMELVEGVTLADRLQTGALPLDEARRVAVQIAGALATAHERGIVHRDLKPGNVMLTRTGADGSGAPQVKLLDFGLAKATGSDAENVLRSSAATKQALTVRGTIVGTLPYMAPEQMAGQAADARSDLFSFGAVLYEMVTGRRAFGGDTPAAVMASVISSQPMPPRSVRPGIPAGLERLIVTCLAKEPAGRWQSAHDVALCLEGPEDSRVEPAPGGPQRRVRLAAAVLLSVGAIGMATGWALRSHGPTPAPAQVARLSLALPADGPPTSPAAPRAGSSIAISRDGRRVIYRSRRDGRNMLVLRAIDRTEETVLRGTEEGFGPFFSPDGSWVAFFTETELKKVPLDGGGPVTICPTAPVSRGGSWADDDTIYFTEDYASGVKRVAAAGGLPQNATTVDLAAQESNHLFADVLPGGELVIFTVWKGGTFDAASTWALSTRTGKRTLLLEGASGARYLPQGYLVFARGGTLFAVPFDPKTLALPGTPAPVVEGVWQDPTTGTAHFAISHTGTLVYAPGQYTRANRRLAWVDRHGTIEFLPCQPGFYTELKLSPDGRRLAFHLLNDIWVYDIQNRTMTRMTFRGVNQAPVWTPDGRHIAFSSSHNVTRPTLYWADPAGGEEPEVLSRDGEVQFPSSWSPDGRTLAFAEVKPASSETDIDVWLLAGGGPWKRQVLIRTPFKDDQPMFSPDGGALAWVSDDTGRPQVYVRPYPGTGRTLVSPDGGFGPIWSRSGTELFYRNGPGFYAVSISAKAGITAGRPRLLFEGAFERGSITPGIPEYDVAPDGRFIVVTSTADAESPSRLDVVMNWVEDLKRRAPRQTRR